MKANGRIARALRWLRHQLVEEVPTDIAPCEFDCRKGQCRYGEWATCKRRLEIVAAMNRPPKTPAA